MPYNQTQRLVAVQRVWFEPHRRHPRAEKFHEYAYHKTTQSEGLGGGETPAAGRRRRIQTSITPNDGPA